MALRYYANISSLLLYMNKIIIKPLPEALQNIIFDYINPSKIQFNKVIGQLKYLFFLFNDGDYTFMECFQIYRTVKIRMS